MSTHEAQQEVADTIQDRLSGTKKSVNLHEYEQDSNIRILLLEKEVMEWREKFVAMEKAWHVLAKATITKIKS